LKKIDLNDKITQREIAPEVFYSHRTIEFGLLISVVRLSSMNITAKSSIHGNIVHQK
jgi:hypothetical protein